MPTGTWAIFLRRAEESVVFFLEDEATSVLGHATSPGEPGWNFPQYLELPAERLHIGHNVVYARLYPSSVGEHQLSVVMIGPASELLRLFRDQLVVQVIGPLTVGAITAVVGLFMLALWLQSPTNTVFGWLGLACAFMVLHFARFFLPDPPASAYLRAVGDGSFGWMVLALLVFVLRMAGRRHRRVEIPVALYALAGTVLLLAAVDRPAFVTIRDAYTLGLLPVEIAVLVYQCMVAWRTRAPMMIALALAAIATVGLGIHDLYARNIASLPDTPVYLMPYSPLVLTLAAGGAVIERMVQSHRALDRLNAELEARAGERDDVLAVDGDGLRGQAPRAHEDVAAARHIDDAQPHHLARGYPREVRVGERAPVGEERIVSHIGQIRFHGHLHAGSAHLHALRGAAAKIGKNGRWIACREVVEHDHDVLHLRARRGFPNDQGRSQHQLLLKSKMRMHPVRAGLDERKIVQTTLSRLDRGLRHVRHAVLSVGEDDAVPVDGERIGHGVVDGDPEAITAPS